MAKTGHPNTVHEFTSPWRGSGHVWRLTANHSGTSFTTDPNRISWLQSLFGQFLLFISPQDTATFCSGVKYYDGETSVPLYEATFVNEAAAAAAGYALGGSTVTANQGEAYSEAEAGDQRSGLESCCVLLAPVGTNSKGKPVFMRKYIHAVPGTTGQTNELPFNDLAQGYAAALGNGSLYGSRVLCSASGAQGDWSADLYYGNHQLYRRAKKKTSLSSASTSSLLQRILESAAGSGLASELETVIAGL